VKQEKMSGKREDSQIIMVDMPIVLKPHLVNGGNIAATDHGWRLVLPPGSPSSYRLAQLDDYTGRSRKAFFHSLPFALSLRARLSTAALPGTWGFGLWNDPFGLSLGFGGQAAHLPALPQTAWFFHASPPNWLSLKVGVPGDGFFAGTLRSPRIPTLLLAPALLMLPLCAIRPISRFFRRLAGTIIQQDGVPVDVDVTQWHEYSIAWRNEACTFHVDGNGILSTLISPHAPLGLVIWIDNQFAAWNPQGHLAYGTQANSASWLEIEDLVVSH
jgi:hypothetical protein